jgi:hypothetical protein
MLSRWIHFPLLLSVIASLSVGAGAQTPSASTDPSSPPEVVSGGYVIHQSNDLGVRVSNITGSDAMYNTLVDLHTGPRVLDQMLSMRSENHQGNSFRQPADP